MKKELLNWGNFRRLIKRIHADQIDGNEQHEWDWEDGVRARLVCIPQGERDENRETEDITGAKLQIRYKDTLKNRSQEYVFPKNHKIQRLSFNQLKGLRSKLKAADLVLIMLFSLPGSRNRLWDAMPFSTGSSKIWTLDKKLVCLQTQCKKWKLHIILQNKIVKPQCDSLTIDNS